MTTKNLVSIGRFLLDITGTERTRPEHTNELPSVSAEAIGSVIEEIDEGVLIADASDPHLRLIHVESRLRDHHGLFPQRSDRQELPLPARERRASA